MRETTSLVKISRPHPSGVLARQRLFHLLDQSRTKPAIWIKGPPGSGKTILVASYLDARKLLCLWYQVDASDTDIASFFYYLGLAAKKAAPRKKEPLPLLTLEHLQDIPTFTRRYFEKFYSRLIPRFGSGGRRKRNIRPLMIVLDNYHEIPEGSAFHEVMREGLSQVPTGINVILISRRDPPDAFVRLKANRLIDTIGWKELRFTLDESKEMIRLCGYEKMPTQVLRQVYEKVDGWAAGLVLLMEGMKREGIELVLGKAPLPEEIFRYFAREIFDKVEPAFQDFFLKTAFLPQMSSQMAEALTGNPRAQRILSYLALNNFFTQRHEAETVLYQYHPLLREFLQAMARETLGPEDLLRIEKGAAVVLEQNGQVEDAIGLLMEARDWPGAVALILKHSPDLVRHGRGQTLEGWVRRLPESVVEGEPWLLYWFGVCRLPFSPPQSRDLFEKAFNIFRRKRDIVGTFLSLSGLFELTIFSPDDFRPFDRAIALLDEILQEFEAFPSMEIEARLATNMLYAMTLRQPDHPKIETWTERVASLSQKTPDINVKALAVHALFFRYLLSGELSKAETVLDACRDLGRSPNVTPLFSISFKDLDAFYCWLTASFEENRRAVEEGLDLSSATGVRLLDVFLLGHGAAGALSSGDWAGAKVFLKEMASYLPRVGSWAKAFHYTLSAWAALIEGNLSKALSDSELGSKFAMEAGQPQTQIYPDIAAAIILHELKRYREAERHILKSGILARSARDYIGEFTCFLAEARFAFDKGDEGSGLASLKKALSMGQEKGYVNTYFWQPAVMANLCKKALEADIEVKYVQSLIQKRHLMPDPPPYDCERWPWPLKINTLGRFEMVKDGEPMQFPARAPRKVLSLLKMLISFGRKGASESQLTDSLWPDADGDTAQQAFDTTLHRLRQLLGNEKLIQLREGHVKLNPRYSMVDSYAFEQLLEQADATGSIPLIEKALTLYQGTFLSDDPGEPWAISYRERLRSKFLRSVSKLGSQLEGMGQIEKAIEHYEKALEVDHVAEEFYQRLMVCYQTEGRRAEALSIYNRCRSVLQSVFGIEPSAKIKTLYDTIRRSK